MLTGVMITMIVEMGAMLAWGRLSDRIGRKPVYLICALSLVACAFPFFWLPDTRATPTLLVCLNRSSAMHATFERNRHVCINVLPAEHELLARHVAGLTDLPMERRFELPVWDRGEQDVPVLRNALASLQGTIAEMKEVGSHSVMFIEATSIRVRDDGDSLIYFSRAFHRVSRTACVR